MAAAAELYPVDIALDGSDAQRFHSIRRASVFGSTALTRSEHQAADYRQPRQAARRHQHCVELRDCPAGARRAQGAPERLRRLLTAQAGAPPALYEGAPQAFKSVDVVLVWDTEAECYALHPELLSRHSFC